MTAAHATSHATYPAVDSTTGATTSSATVRQTPATVTDENWTWRLPWRVDTLSTIPAAQERAAFCAQAARAAGRG